MDELDIDTRARSLPGSLVVLLFTTRVISESAVRWGLWFFVLVRED